MIKMVESLAVLLPTCTTLNPTKIGMIHFELFFSLPVQYAFMFHSLFYGNLNEHIGIYKTELLEK